MTKSLTFEDKEQVHTDAMRYYGKMKRSTQTDKGTSASKANQSGNYFIFLFASSLQTPADTLTNSTCGKLS